MFARNVLLQENLFIRRGQSALAGWCYVSVFVYPDKIVRVHQSHTKKKNLVCVCVCAYTCVCMFLLKDELTFTSVQLMCTRPLMFLRLF